MRARPGERQGRFAWKRILGGAEHATAFLWLRPRHDLIHVFMDSSLHLYQRGKACESTESNVEHGLVGSSLDRELAWRLVEVAPVGSCQSGHRKTINTATELHYKHDDDSGS